MPTSMTTSGTVSARTRFLHAGTETYAYRRFGGGPARPLLFLQHFMGTLYNWDPAVADPLASGREVILFDNAGVGRSTLCRAPCRRHGDPVEKREDVRHETDMRVGTAAAVPLSPLVHGRSAAD